MCREHVVVARTKVVVIELSKVGSWTPQSTLYQANSKSRKLYTSTRDR